MQTGIEMIANIPKYRPKFDITGKEVKTIEITADNYLGQYNNVTLLSHGSLFWHGEIIEVSIKNCNHCIRATTSGVLDKIVLNPNPDDPDDMDISIHYVDWREFDNISPPKGVRPYYSLMSGMVSYIPSEEAYIDNLRIGKHRHGHIGCLAQSFVENGDHIETNDLLFLYFPKYPTPEQLQNFSASKKLPSVKDELSEWHKKIKNLKTEVVSGIQTRC